MAAATQRIDLPQLLYQCNNVDKFRNCANCSHLEYQLHATNEELNSAKTIIALLQEDLINLNSTRTAGQQPTHNPRGMRYNVCEYNPIDENWTTITHNKDKYRNKGNQIDVIKKTHSNYTTNNCFEPLANLKEMQPSNMTAQYKPGKQHQTGNTVRNTTDPASRRKIPPIVNRNINSHKDIVTQPLAGKQCLKSNKPAVKIISDSHLCDSVMRINQYLNSKYVATGLIKPGATTKKIVTSGENEFQGLGEKDVVVLNCGANDIEKENSSISAIITPVIDFSQKYSNTNIIVLEIPHRHDLHYKDLTNKRI